MKKYDKYKDSGIEWIGEIPEHWETIRLKYIGYLYGGLSGKSSKDFNQNNNPNNKPFIPFTNIANNIVVDPQNLQYVIINENEKQNRVEKNDIFFMMSSENYEEVGKSAILLDNLGEIYLNSFCKGFRITSKDYFPTFINYLLLSHSYRNLLLIEANGFTRINLKIDKINNITLKVPPLNEQVKIANFLDRKTAQIDELIAKKERLLELYEEEKSAIINRAVTKGINPNVKMKDSGIEWIGKIPEHWEIEKLGWQGIFSASGIDKKIVDGEPLVKMINYTDIYGNKDLTLTRERDYMIVSCPKEKKKVHQVKVGDLIFTPSSETADEIGLSALVTDELPDTVYSYHVIRLRFTKEFDINYRKYLCNNNFVLNQFSKEAKGTTRQIIGREVFKNINVIIPPLNEQIEIAHYIEKETARIDAKIEKTKRLIELLKEYKQALISEAVTGKIKIA